MPKEKAASVCAYATVIEATKTDATARVFGLDARERLRRSFALSGLRTIEPEAIAALGEERVLALCSTHFYDDRLVAALAVQPEDVLLLANEGEQAPAAVGFVGAGSRVDAFLRRSVGHGDPREAARSAGFEVRFPDDLVPSYDPRLRKKSIPFVLRADPERTRAIEARIFDASYKGATDFVTKWVWPLPARIVTEWCARWNVSPNAITALSYLLTLFVLVEFWRGAFVAGLLGAWVMTFLDTVDGKLARVTLSSSKLGDVLDHGLDLVHPPLWWAAWGAGLAGAGSLFGPFDFWVAIVFGGYVVGRLLEGLFILAFGQEMFSWRPFDRAFRLVIARRNPNLVLLSGATLAGRPDLGLIAVGAWTVACILIQAIRIAQAMLERARGREVVPYGG